MKAIALLPQNKGPLAIWRWRKNNKKKGLPMKPECPLPSTNPIFVKPECPLESVKAFATEPICEAGMLLKICTRFRANPFKPECDWNQSTSLKSTFQM